LPPFFGNLFSSQGLADMLSFRSRGQKILEPEGGGIQTIDGISETGSDIIPNSDKKRNNGTFVKKLFAHCGQGKESLKMTSHHLRCYSSDVRNNYVALLTEEATMKLRFVLVFCLVLLMCTACTAIRYSSSEQTPIDEVIVGYKRALVVAQEKSLFEEFVKYKELHYTFALYAISELNIEASTNIKKSSSEKGEASMKWPVGGGLGINKTIEVGDEQGTKISLKLAAIGNTPETYKEVKQVFDKTPGLDIIYGIVYYDNSGNPTSTEAGADCEASLYCVPIRNLTDSHKNKGFAYLESYDEYRKLLNTIREIKGKEEKKEGNIKGSACCKENCPCQ
jgi:hypothetical protein